MNWKRYEPTLHRLLGLVASAIPGGVLLVYWIRELKRLPPENDANPVVYLLVDAKGNTLWPFTNRDTAKLEAIKDGDVVREYWSKVRVMDLLNDTKEYLQGAAVGWLLTLGLGVLIGWGVWG